MIDGKRLVDDISMFRQLFVYYSILFQRDVINLLEIQFYELDYFVMFVMDVEKFILDGNFKLGKKNLG